MSSSTAVPTKRDSGESNRTSIQRRGTQKYTRRETHTDTGLKEKNAPVVSIT